jgi:YggT family protein
VSAWFLLKALGSIFSVACLLRAYLQWAKLHPMNPLSQMVFRFTDWLVIPLRRLFPPQSKLDWGSLASATLVAIVLAIVEFLWVTLDPALALQGPVVRPFGLVFILALIWVCGWAMQLAVVLLLAQAVLGLFSRNPTAASIRPVLTVLVKPLIRPVWKLTGTPKPGSLDFSPIAVFLVLQLALSLQGWLENLVHQALFTV